VTGAFLEKIFSFRRLNFEKMPDFEEMVDFEEIVIIK